VAAWQADLSQLGSANRLQDMKHMPLTSTTATPRDDARTPQPPRPTFGEMLEELMDLSAGLGVALLPLLVLAVPGIILFVVLPVILLLALAAPLAAIGAVIAVPPYLLARWLRRRRRRTASPPAGLADSAPRSVRTSGQSLVDYP
jgi:Flp pilus assembly protein TadB